MLETGSPRRRRNRKLFVILALTAAGMTGAKSHAALPAQIKDVCASPPYGGTVAGYKAYVKTFGMLGPPAQVYSATCRAKFENGDRTGLYNLGFTDSEIDSESVDDLVIKILIAMKRLADQIQ